MVQNKHNEKYLDQAQMLSNKVKKKYKHLNKRYSKQNIEIFRLYDWDIPEIRAVVDWYAGHLVVAEYVRKSSDPAWLEIMARAVAQTLGVDMAKVHLKQRYSGYQDGNRYERVAHTDKKIVMSERDLKFYINLHDYVDTGLFSDHRNTRQMVREISQGKDFLNLYCYTGSFSCYAAKGGAKTTVSVDRSDTAIQWTKENMELNGISLKENTLIKAHTFDFLEKARKKGQMFDIAVVDPPSFSSSRDSRHHFDITKDHPALLKSVVELMHKDSGSTIFFSTNHQDFEFCMDQFVVGESSAYESKRSERSGLETGASEDGGSDTQRCFVKEIKEITPITIPEDYITPKKKIHRCWKIIV
ncbi:MAG: class I SAM-dependent methyltransferase [Desulfamplus sp.]|nr:class I SAM-dependent methyltransferase [Desulfamplus sp.]